MTQEKVFQSTLSLRRATSGDQRVLGIHRISIHALLAESDRGRAVVNRWHGNFNPRSPCGERPTRFFLIRATGQFQSTLSLRRATTVGKSYALPGNISIHALLAESDQLDVEFARMRAEFQSTLSLRRATRSSVEIVSVPPAFQSTLSLRRATLDVIPLSGIVRISIHALLAESDRDWPFMLRSSPRFQSTLSLRRATRGSRATRAKPAISIHALLAESDCFPFRWCGRGWHFNPRSPCGERHQRPRCHRRSTRISIHALLAESDIAQ